MFLKRTIVLFLACVGICFGQSVWTPQNSGTTQNLYSVAYDSQFVASGDFVVKGDSGILLTSADAITWTKSSAYSYTFNSTKVYGNGVFVRVFVGAGSPLNFQVSLPYDDSLFISIEYPEAKTNPLSFPNSVTYGGNRQFVAVGYFTTCNYLYNPQGQCGNSGLILVSPPGWNGTYGSANWEEVNDPRPLDSLCSVIYGNGSIRGRRTTWYDSNFRSR